MPQHDLDSLTDFLAPRRRLFVLTGAGCSTESGIPDYRDADGQWKHRQPMQYREFVGSHEARQRYWSRSLVGWRRIAGAEPNAAHQALARLENAGRVCCLVTQNVDRLHHRAGSRALIDLHGRLDRVECPAVVFFGENVPRRRVDRAFAALDEADAVLVAGSSLMVFSGYRFARAAAERGVPLALLNLGRTRADAEATLKVEGRCGEVLPRLVERLGNLR